MKARIGQWARTSGGLFYKIEMVLIDWLVIGDKMGVKIKDVKVADNPRELIEVGDLVEVIYQHSNDKLPLGEVIYKDEYFINIQSASVRYDRVTKILTPNKDKSVYTKQWSESNEK